MRLKPPPLNSKLLGNTDLFTLDMGSLRKEYPLSFYLSKAVLLVFLYFIAANNSVLLLYAYAHEISLKYLFPEKMSSKYVDNFFPLNFKILSNKKYQIYTIES